MSPIDDELRAALHGRAQVLAPSPDPLGGIERRAKRIRRNRTAAAVAGSALAVVMIAVAVPALQSTTSSAPNVPQFATAGPSAEPKAVSRYALDPKDPWPYRGDPQVLENRNMEAFATEWTVRHGIAEAIDFRPLYGEFHEPSGEATLVYVAAGGGQTRWGVVRSSESGPEFLLDEELADDTRALAWATAGEQVPRLVVVAWPEAGQIEYGHDDASEFDAMESIAPGVAVTPLDGDPATDSFRVLDRDGQEVVRAPAPDPAPSPRDEGAGTVSDDEAAAYSFVPAQPWPFRGLEEVEENIVVEDERLFFAAQPGRSAISWASTPLYYGQSDAGMHYLLMLHTAEGQEPVVTTTWQRGDREYEQTEQGVEPGQKLIQTIVPTDLDDGSVMLVALASPRAGGIVLDQPDGNRPDGIGDPGVGLWLLDQGKRDGMVRLYTEGDGLEYYAEPVDVGPGA